MFLDDQSYLAINEEHNRYRGQDLCFNSMLSSDSTLPTTSGLTPTMTITTTSESPLLMAAASLHPKLAAAINKTSPRISFDPDPLVPVTCNTINGILFNKRPQDPIDPLVADAIIVTVSSSLFYGRFSNIRSFVKNIEQIFLTKL